jgi:uncharacterized protein (DUF1015 family)
VPKVAPFDGLLYDPAVVGDVAAATAPPYDVILADELARFRKGSPYSITHVDLTDGTGGAAGQDQYTRAGAIFRGWREEGALRPVGKPSYYAYEMSFSYGGRDRRIRGVILEVGLEPWGGAIVPHERTMPGPVEDRLALLRATGANLSPIYAVASGPAQPQSALLDRAAASAPTVEVEDERGVLHRLWIVDPDDDLAAWYAGQTLLIADGHHRYQTALVYQEEMRASRGPGPWDSTMMLVVDAATEDPPVLPIHRVVKVDEVPPLPGHLVRDLTEVLASLHDDDLQFGAAFRRGEDLSHLVGRLEGQPPTVDALHRTLLERLEGVREVRFVPDAVVAEDAVRFGDADLALFLPPARVASIREVLERGERLPQKSTYFWPKPRTGLVVRPLA